MVYISPFHQPDSWDEDEDGIWKPPKVPNPAYKGPWKRKVCQKVLMTDRKILKFDSLLVFLITTCFKWQRIKNPNYKGKWKIPWIDNPGIPYI